MSIELTRLERSLARRALGLDNARGTKKTYRNHYVVKPENSEGERVWLDLVARGLAKGKGMTFGDSVFWCTRELALAVLEPDEHLSRGFHE